MILKKEPSMHLQIRGVNISIKAVNKGSAEAKSEGEV